MLTQTDECILEYSHPGLRIGFLLKPLNLNRPIGYSRVHTS